MLWDWGAHWMAVCLDLLGRSPSACDCEVITEREVQGGIGQCVVVRLAFEAGARARLELDNLLDAPRRRLAVTTGDDRVLVYDELQDQPLTEQIDAKPPAPVPVPATRPLTAALQHFSATFADWQAGRPPRCRSDLSLGVDVVRVLAACESSARSRRP